MCGNGHEPDSEAETATHHHRIYTTRKIRKNALSIGAYISFRKSEEAGACRVSGLVDFSYPHSRSCNRDEVCKSFLAAMAQKLSDGEEVNAFLWGHGTSRWCSYVITFNSTTAMEAAGIHQFLRQKEFFSEYLSSNSSFPSDAAHCQPELVTITRVTEPITSLVAATTSVAHWQVGKKTMNFGFSFKFNPRADLPPPCRWELRQLRFSV